jgi:hypothetical protein
MARPPAQARLRDRQRLRDPRRLHGQVIEATLAGELRYLDEQVRSERAADHPFCIPTSRSSAPHGRGGLSQFSSVVRWINAGGELAPGVLVTRPHLFEGNVGIDSQRQRFLLLLETVVIAPIAIAIRGDRSSAADEH